SDPAAGDLRAPDRDRDAGQGDHQRGARARPDVQRRRARAVHQWRAGRRQENPRPGVTTQPGRRARPPARVASSDRSTMTDEQQPDQQKASDQLRQRRANFEELQRLGVPAYPHAFTRTNTVAELVEAHGGTTGEALDAAKIQATTAGRVMAIRNFGKANFLV